MLRSLHGGSVFGGRAVDAGSRWPCRQGASSAPPQSAGSPGVLGRRRRRSGRRCLGGGSWRRCAASRACRPRSAPGPPSWRSAPPWRPGRCPAGVRWGLPGPSAAWSAARASSRRAATASRPWRACMRIRRASFRARSGSMADQWPRVAEAEAGQVVVPVSLPGPVRVALGQILAGPLGDSHRTAPSLGPHRVLN